jgi:hypothetical protein
VKRLRTRGTAYAYLTATGNGDLELSPTGRRLAQRLWTAGRP